MGYDTEMGANPGGGIYPTPLISDFRWRLSLQHFISAII